MKPIYAVIWQDLKLGGLPLSLHCDSIESTIARAKDMHARARDTLAGLRAVSVPTDTDTLETIWAPPS